MQVTVDRERLSARRPLLLRKWRRMVASPFAFLRGASPLWAEALRREPRLLGVAPGTGGVVGDLHLENFGTFRSASGFTFHVNDFDESFDGPWTFDVLRLLVSTLLAREALGCTGAEVLALAETVLDGYVSGLEGGRRRRPDVIEGLIQTAASTAPAKLLSKRVDAAGRLVRDAEKTPEAPADVRAAVPAALAQWWAALGDGPWQVTQEALRVVDVTRRIAGTGSLGVERLQVLTRGEDGPWLLEVKALRGSPASSAAADGARVVALLRRALPSPPLAVGHAVLRGEPVLIHPLFAGEDKLSVGELPREAVGGALRHLGFLAGEVHRRAATRPARWTTAHQRAVTDAAVSLAGLHALAFLEFSRLVSDELGRAARG